MMGRTRQTAAHGGQPNGRHGWRRVACGAFVAALGAIATGPAAPFDAVRAANVAQFAPPPRVERIYLSLVMRQALRRDIPAAQTAPPPTNTPEPTNTSEPTAVPSPTAIPGQPGPCRGPLDTRVSTRPIDIGEYEVNRRATYFTSMPVLAAPVDLGRTIVAWPDTDGQIHFSFVTSLGRREHDDVKVQGDSVHGLAAVGADGGAALVRNNTQMLLVRFKTDGTVPWKTVVVGDGGTGSGKKWARPDWTHESRLRWTGEVFAAYIGHTQNFGSGGVHQGDLMWLFDGDGKRVLPETEKARDYPQWDWGCSHSLDVRLRYNRRQDIVGPVCLSDSFPAKAIVYRHGPTLKSEPSGDGNGHSDAALGGLVTIEGRGEDDGFALNFQSKEGRKSYDIGLVRVYGDAEEISDPYWFTNSAAVDEVAPHMANYGEHLLVGWNEGDQLKLSVFSTRAEPREAPVSVPAAVGAHDDFENYPNGDVGWAYASDDGTQLRLARVQLCYP
ncbi:MAG: hypothetical protein IPG72_05335 [Ardenticatenales bacterium]|nr:hypothetical protein [Ardenticatenales bacterium]